MSKKAYSQRVLAGIAVFCALAFQVHGEPDRLFEPAPRSDDGRFINWASDLSHGSATVRSKFFLGRVGATFRAPTGVPERIVNDGAYLRENARHSEPTVTWIGHATMLVQMEHLTFLTDPIWSDRASPVPIAGPKRQIEPGVAMADLPPIDFVLISHNHYDHLDLPTLRALAKRNAETVFFVPLGNGQLLRDQGIKQVEELDWGDTARFENATIHCLPVQHWSKRSLTDTRKSLWSSWAVTGEQRRFYFAGDTGYFRGFKEIGDKLGPFDLAAIPIGAYEPRAMMEASHMNPEEAIQAALDVKAKTTVAMHFGTFNLADEPMSEPPLRFKKAAAKANISAENSWVLRIGETRRF